MGKLRGKRVERQAVLVFCGGVAGSPGGCPDNLALRLPMLTQGAGGWTVASYTHAHLKAGWIVLQSSQTPEGGEPQSFSYSACSGCGIRACQAMLTRDDLTPGAREVVEQHIARMSAAIQPEPEPEPEP